MNTKYITRVTKQSKKSSLMDIALHSNLFFKRKHYCCWAPTKAQFIFVWINSINPIIENYRIKFMFISKHLKNQEKCEMMFAGKKMEANLIEKWGFWWS